MEDLKPARSLVGRGAEIGTLGRNLEEAFEGLGRFVLLSGEAGVGKTSLAAELARLAKNSGTVLYGRCLPHNLSPFLVFGDALEELFKIDPDDSSIVRSRKFSRTIRNLGIRGWLSGPETNGVASRRYTENPTEMAENFSVIRGVMRAQTARSTKRLDLGLEFKAKRNWLFESVAELLQRSSKAKPILMILDDLQWADPSSLSLLHYLARNIGSTSMLILGTYRVEELGDTGDGQARLLDSLRLLRTEGLVRDVTLDRLKPTEVAELLENELRNHPPPDLARVLYQETEGNPLFIIELLRLMIQDKLLVKQNEHWTLSSPIEKLRVPEKVHEVISRRLDRLSPPERNLLECASVLGDRFDSYLLGTTLNIKRARLVRILSDLEKKHRLIHFFKGGYQFDHSKIRDVLYQEMGEELRMNYHSEVAENMVRFHEREPDPLYSTIAYHYNTGGASRKALEYYEKAAEAAKNKFALEESILHLNEALTILGGKTTLETARVLEELGDVHDLAGDFTKSIESWKRAIHARKAVEPERVPETVARLHRKIASALQVRGDFASASAEIESGLLALGTATSAERGWLKTVNCRVYMLLEKWQTAKQEGKEALRIFQDLLVPRGEAQALEALGRIEADSPDGSLSAAELTLTKALDLSKSIGDLDLTASVHTQLARLFAYLLGDTDRAMSQIVAIEKLPGALRDPHKRRALLMLRGWMSLKVKGDFEASEANFREATILAERVQDPFTLAGAKFGQASVAYYSGRFGEARRLFEECTIELREQRLFGYAVEAMCMTAECSLLEGDLEGFQRIIVGLEDPEIQAGVQARLGMTQAIQGISLVTKGDTKGSYALFSKVMRLSENVPEVEQTPFVHYIYGVVLQVVGDREAQDHLDKAATLLKAHHREGMLATLPLRANLLTQTLRRVSTP